MKSFISFMITVRRLINTMSNLYGVVDDTVDVDDVEWYLERTDGRTWISDYMGRYYYDDPNATELASMAMEYLYTDPMRLATRDPELFDIVVGYCHGTGGL